MVDNTVFEVEERGGNRNGDFDGDKGKHLLALGEDDGSEEDGGRHLSKRKKGKEAKAKKVEQRAKKRSK